MVECPLQDLDMSKFVPFPEFLDPYVSHHYDLYAVINHFGIM